MRHTSCELILACGLVLTSIDAARADCAADFAELNRIKLAAGPYEIDSQLRIIPPTTSEHGGSPVMSMSSTQIVPPYAVRVRTRSAEVILIGGDKGWVAAGGSLTEVPKDKLSDLAGEVSLDGYFVTRGQHDLTCQGPPTVEGKPYLTFAYEAVMNATSRVPQPVRVTAHFDPTTRLPVSGRMEADLLGAKMHTDLTYRFDPAIAIEPPAR